MSEGFKVIDRRGRWIAFTFEPDGFDGEGSYLRVPPWVVSVARWLYRWVL